MTAVFRELARVFHQYGGVLTIRPEEDWVKGGQKFAPATLREPRCDRRERHADYSKHLAGRESVVDAAGQLRRQEASVIL